MDWLDQCEPTPHQPQCEIRTPVVRVILPSLLYSLIRLIPTRVETTPSACPANRCQLLNFMLLKWYIFVSVRCDFFESFGIFGFSLSPTRISNQLPRPELVVAHDWLFFNDSYNSGYTVCSAITYLLIWISIDTSRRTTLALHILPCLTSNIDLLKSSGAFREEPGCGLVPIT